MIQFKELNQLFGFIRQPGIGCPKQARKHRTVMFLPCHDDIVDHGHFRKDRKLLKRASNAQLVQLVGRSASHRLAVHINLARIRGRLAQNAIE